MTHSACLIAARRTFVSPKGGAFKSVSADDLACTAALACLADAGIEPEQVDEVVLSNCLGIGGNIARRVALKTGLNEAVAGLSIDRQCCGGLDALLLAETMIKSGRARIVLAGGTESASLRPVCYPKVENGCSTTPIDQAPFTPWPGRDPNMHEAAAKLAYEFAISKDDQDKWAIASHSKAVKAHCRLQAEVAHVVGSLLNRDEFSRDLKATTCRRAPKVCGPITAANMSVAADGAAMCLVVAEVESKSHEYLKILSGRTIGGDPEMPGIAPVVAIRRALSDCGLTPSNLAVVEMMEAYAVQAIACTKVSEIDNGIVNLGGGALARGHPVGASGTILAVRLFHELRNKTSGSLGLAAIAAAGGLGTAVVFQSVG